jgi:hypothetical protein
MKKQGKLRDEWTLRHGQQRNSPKRKSEVKDQDFEPALSLCFSIITERFVVFSLPMLRSKSVELAKKFGHNDCKATAGWLSRCKCMFGIKIKKSHGKKYGADTVIAQ